MNMETQLQATEDTEGTEKKRFVADRVFSVISVSSVARCFF